MVLTEEKPCRQDGLITTDFARFRADPLGFVRFAFPWGEAGELEKYSGPDAWQCDILRQIGERLEGDPYAVNRTAVASGHGIGKSALVAWLILWGLSTFEDTKVVVTANTEGQLRTKTWPELAKWHRLALNSSWFRFTATALASANPLHEKTWRADAIPWSEHATEAFAGLHNAGKRLLLVMDEASAIADSIWDVAEGAMTDQDTEIIWTAFGNPTKPAGRFRECFAGGRFAHRWENRQIDSRAVAMTSKEQLNQWVTDYGEDSDFVRVRVRGIFPKAGALQFIGPDLVAEAVRRNSTSVLSDPLIMGVDVARFGDDSSVIAFRKGRDGRAVPWSVFHGLDAMQLAGRIAALIGEHRPAAVFIDEGGAGGGVIDRLRQLGFTPFGVNFGAKPEERRLYANKRAEMWGRMREWLKDGAIPSDPDLSAQLGGPEYSYDKDSRILLEKKADMKRRGLASPDHADALALTFAWTVAPQTAHSQGGQASVRYEFDPYAY